MIDIAREQLLSLNDVADRIGCSIQTVRKWASVGCDGRILETVKFGRLVRTSLQAVERFHKPRRASQDFSLRSDHTEFSRCQSALLERHG